MSDPGAAERALERVISIEKESPLVGDRKRADGSTASGHPVFAENLREK